MADFRLQLQKVLEPYSDEPVGSQTDIYKKFSNKISDLVNKRFKDAESYDGFAKRFGILVKVFPVLVTIVTGVLYQFDHKTAGAIVAIVSILGYLLLLLFEYWIPKDGTSFQNAVKTFEMEKALQILGSQIVFYSNLQKILNKDNEDHTNKLSTLIDEQLTFALKKKSDVIKDIIQPGHRNQDLFRSAVEVENIPKVIYSKLSPLGENISEACQFIFGPGKYSVKIYLKSKHKVDELGGVEISMLTSLVKFPYNGRHSDTAGGRSWINCKGHRASVWNCYDGQDDVLCYVDEVKKNHPLEKYPSIAYIRLPEGMGVLTITSSSAETFKDASVITEEVKKTLMIATAMYTQEALYK